MPGLIESLCYGLKPSEFIRQELSLNPLQLIVAKRIFVLLMIFAVIIEATRLPQARVVGMFVALLMPPLMVTSRMAYDGIWSFAKLIIIGASLGILILVVTLDQGWMRLPIAISVIILMMFDARVHRVPSLTPVYFGIIALYNTNQIQSSLDNALWYFPILLGPLVLAGLLSATILWPLRATDVFRKRMQIRMEGTDRLISALIAIAPGEAPDPGMKRSHSMPGWTADTLKQLDDAARDEADIARRKDAWSACIMEIDNLDGGLSDYQRLWLDSPSPAPVSREEHAVLEGIRNQFALARNILDSNGQIRPSPDITLSIPLDHPKVSHILRRQYLAAERLTRNLDALHHDSPSPEVPLKPPAPSETKGLFAAINDPENRQILLWSLKVGIACFIVSLMVESMEANTVDTAILTTIIVADSTLGADFRKSVMRLTGALLGAVLGYLWLILGQPAADTIAGFLVTIIPFLALVSWCCATSPRMSYAGVQMGLAFCMIAFGDLEPGTYLGSGWYRVLGILLGISVMGLVDYLLWPARSIVMARLRLIQIFRMIETNLRKSPDMADFTIAVSVRMLRSMDQNLKDAKYFLDFARLEPGSSQAWVRREMEATDALIQGLLYLSKVIESRHRLYLDGRAIIDSLYLAKLQSPIKLAYADEYKAMARYLQTGERLERDHIFEDELGVFIARLEAIEAFQTLNDQERLFVDALLDLERKHAQVLREIRAQIEDNLVSRAIPLNA